eukprot:9497227-Pyramimonas_sp.AAC.1
MACAGPRETSPGLQGTFPLLGSTDPGQSKPRSVPWPAQSYGTLKQVGGGGFSPEHQARRL